jgi:sigma-E factor negative regulatory protein RseC
VIQEKGTVVGLRGGRAVVRLERSEACVGCHGGCFVDPGSRSMVAQADNLPHARIGDRVEVDSTAPGTVKSGFILLILPLLALLTGLLAGNAVGSHLGITPEIVGLPGGIAAAALTYMLIHRWQKRRLDSTSERLRVVRILPQTVGGG